MRIWQKTVSGAFEITIVRKFAIVPVVYRFDTTICRRYAKMGFK